MFTEPTRFPGGLSVDHPFQPLYLIGTENPFYYSVFRDDFQGYVAGFYTITNSGNGTVAGAPGLGGRLLFTTNSSVPATTDVSSAQVDIAGFTYTASHKLAYLARGQLSDVTNAAMIWGLIQQTATPFTVTDGIYFSKASGSTVINLIVMAGSVQQGIVAIPSSALTLANATDFDLSFTVTHKGEIIVYAGPATAGLIGNQPNQNTAQLGPIARLTPAAFPTANLTPTMALQSGTATSKTMNADFLFAAYER